MGRIALSRRASMHAALITALIAGSISVLPTVSKAGIPPTAQPLPGLTGFELEPNNTSAGATPLNGNDRVRGHIFPGSDIDFYSFSASAGDRVYAATMTANGPSTDSILALIASDGTTPLETDDNDGVLGASSSSIAGANIPSTGTYYLRVTTLSSNQIRPYDLYLRTRSGAPVPETEPNDPFEPLPGGGWVSGATSSATDVDGYSLFLNRGDTLFASMDLDPERDATEWDGRFTLRPFEDSPIIANDAGTSTPDSEALFVTVDEAGSYTLSVSAQAATFGSYHLSVEVIQAASPDCVVVDSSAPTPIADLGTTTSSIVMGQDFLISRLAIDIDINHANPPDLDITLQTPANNEFVLMADNGNPATPHIDVRFDDAAGYPVNSNTLLMDQMVAPRSNGGRLDWTNGEQAGGQWTLVVRDDTTNNTGTLNSWSVVACPAPPEPDLATVYENDFETNDGGFTHSGTADEWAHGTPTGPPIDTCNSGTKCWKTDLTGTYEALSDQTLVSAPISLEGLSGQVMLSWAQRYQIESANFDHFHVDVRLVGGASPRRLFEWKGPDMAVTNIGNPPITLQQTAGWGRMLVDVSEYAGNTIEVVFHLDSDDSVQMEGLAIDDLRVLADISHDLTVTKDGFGDGTVTSSNVAGIDCGNDCSHTYQQGTVVTLSASASPGSTFVGWSDVTCPGTADCVVTMDGDKTITATFDDSSAPSASTLSDAPEFTLKKKIPLSWTPSTDPESGVVSYEFTRRVAKPNKVLGAPEAAGSFTTTSTKVTGKPGHTYCFTIEAVNGEGLHSAVSAPECTTLPLDDRALSSGPVAWNLRKAKGFYLNTFSIKDVAGASLKRNVTATTLALVATKCPGCGTVKVFFKGKLLKRISLKAPNTQKKKIFALGTFAPAKTGSLVIKIASKNKPVSIDALGVHRL